MKCPKCFAVCMASDQRCNGCGTAVSGGSSRPGLMRVFTIGVPVAAIAVSQILWPIKGGRLTGDILMKSTFFVVGVSVASYVLGRIVCSLFPKTAPYE
jgi:hypothetical protein